MEALAPSPVRSTVHARCNSGHASCSELLSVLSCAYWESAGQNLTFIFLLGSCNHPSLAQCIHAVTIFQRCGVYNRLRSGKEFPNTYQTASPESIDSRSDCGESPAVRKWQRNGKISITTATGRTAEIYITGG